MSVVSNMTVPAATAATLGAITIDRAPASGLPVSVTQYGLAASAPARADRALLQTGDGAFDGSAGAFLGNALGTIWGINVPTGRGGNFFDLQVNGATKLKGDTTGVLTAVSIAVGTVTTTGTLTVPTDILLNGVGGGGSGVQFNGQNAGGTILWQNALFMRGDSDTLSLWANTGPNAAKASMRFELSPGSRQYILVYNNQAGTGDIGVWRGGEVYATSLMTTAYASNWTALVAQGAALQTADLFQTIDSAAHTQFGVTNKGTGVAPVWALKTRAIANAESMAQAHVIGAATGRAIQVMDDAGASLGFIPLYA